MIDLAVLAQRLRAEGRAVKLRAPQPQMRTLIGLVGLDRQPAVALETRLAPLRVHREEQEAREQHEVHAALLQRRPAPAAP